MYCYVGDNTPPILPGDVIDTLVRIRVGEFESDTITGLLRLTGHDNDGKQWWLGLGVSSGRVITAAAAE